MTRRGLAMVGRRRTRAQTCWWHGEHRGWRLTPRNGRRSRYGCACDGGWLARGGSTDRRDHRGRSRGRSRRHPHGARARVRRVPGRGRSRRRARHDPRGPRAQAGPADAGPVDAGRLEPGGACLLLRRPPHAGGRDPDDARGSRVRPPGAASGSAQLRAQGGRAGRAAAGLQAGGGRRQLPAPAPGRADGHGRRDPQRRRRFVRA